MSEQVHVNRHDLKSELESCHAMACFMSDAIYLLLLENGNFNNDVTPVPYGANECLRALVAKIKAISDKI